MNPQNTNTSFGEFVILSSCSRNFTFDDLVSRSISVLHSPRFGRETVIFEIPILVARKMLEKLDDGSFILTKRGLKEIKLWKNVIDDLRLKLLSIEGIA